jgi:hypothetical protein
LLNSTKQFMQTMLLISQLMSLSQQTR